MGFKFKLEAALKHRGMIEDEARRAVAEARRHVEDARRAIDDMYRRTDEVRDEIGQNERLGSPTALEFVRASEQFLLGHARRIQAARQGLSQLLGVLEEKQEALTLAARDKKALARLREKQEREYHVERARREQSEFDEIATIRRAHSMKETRE